MMMKTAFLQKSESRGLISREIEHFEFEVEDRGEYHTA